MVSSIGYTWGNTGPGGQYIHSIYTRLVCVANDSSFSGPCVSMLPCLVVLGPDPWLHVVPVVHGPPEPLLKDEADASNSPKSMGAAGNAGASKITTAASHSNSSPSKAG